MRDWNNRRFKKAFPKKWNRDAESILKAGSVLVDAKSDLEMKSYSNLKRELALSDRTDQKLRKIGKDKRLYEPDVRRKLPDSWGTIEKISTLSNTQFQRFKDAGLLNNDVTREQVESFSKGKTRSKKQKWKSWDKLVTIRVKPYLDEKELQRIFNDLSDVVIGTNSAHDHDVLEIEDHGLIERIESRNLKKSMSEIDKAANEGLKWGRKICRYLVNKAKREAPPYLKKQVKLGQKLPSWSMDETNIITDFDSLQTAFGELGVDDLSVEQLKYDPECGEHYYRKLIKR